MLLTSSDPSITKSLCTGTPRALSTGRGPTISYPLTRVLPKMSASHWEWPSGILCTTWEFLLSKFCKMMIPLFTFRSLALLDAVIPAEIIPLILHTFLLSWESCLSVSHLYT